ncbi:hypothetical protein RN001_005620 [Aquatica leii]|uniref:Uncharacterized protein n=1 Tax=Aquatica leii TaxID=1421715 RepID=A0AAN7SAP0_9COLE|nr:hypothetical protein RN001_005620 [Aquatica leii]
MELLLFGVQTADREIVNCVDETSELASDHILEFSFPEFNAYLDQNYENEMNILQESSKNSETIGPELEIVDCSFNTTEETTEHHKFGKGITILSDIKKIEVLIHEIEETTPQEKSIEENGTQEKEIEEKATLKIEIENIAVQEKGRDETENQEKKTEEIKIVQISTPIKTNRKILGDILVFPTAVTTLHSNGRTFPVTALCNYHIGFQ